jgi:hypothetical protein
MSDLPPNIDAILASIRSRMNEASPPPGDPPEAVTLPPVPLLAPIEPEPAEAAAPDLAAVQLAGGAMTLDGLLRSTLEPVLKAWLDANAPEIVERLAQAEIKRLTRPD